MVEFVTLGIPRTSQTKRANSRQLWKDAVANAAREAVGSNFEPIEVPFSATIIYFYTESTELDVDGIGKLLLDSIKDIVVVDDRYAEQVLLRKTNQLGLAVVNPPEVLSDVLNEHENFVYVKIDGPPKHSEMPI
jgi:Holliday junction resolvase RusA-like endonuclease